MVKGKILIFMGPQGSGKGTQSQLFAQRHGFVILSTGELLRKEAREESTALGKKVSALMHSGDLVQDETIIDVLEKHLNALPENTSVIIDGFPRTVEQSKILDTVATVTRAVYITLPNDVSAQRIIGRRQCPEGHIFNTFTQPPKKEVTCDFDGLTLIRRDDDNMLAVRKRLQLHEQTIAPILAHYRSQGKLVTVNGNQQVEAVAAEITERLSLNEDQQSA